MLVIPTWCKNLDALYGSLLTFQTVRGGFPNDEIVVLDNGSLPQAIEAIGKAAQAVGARFIDTKTEVPHWVLIRQILTTFDGPLVLADPDLIFWKPMTFDDSALWSGRLIPKFRDEYTGCVTMPRLHTSLLSVPNPKVFIELITAIEKRYWEANMLRPAMIPSWQRFDTGAMLYAEVGGTAFTESQLDCYDHLFAGSHFDFVSDRLEAKAKAEMVEIHMKAKAGDLASLRGIWRRQEQHFIDRRI